MFSDSSLQEEDGIAEDEILSSIRLNPENINGMPSPEEEIFSTVVVTKVNETTARSKANGDQWRRMLAAMATRRNNDDEEEYITNLSELYQCSEEASLPSVEVTTGQVDESSTDDADVEPITAMHREETLLEYLGISVKKDTKTNSHANMPKMEQKLTLELKVDVHKEPKDKYTLEPRNGSTEEGNRAHEFVPKAESDQAEETILDSATDPSSDPYVDIKIDDHCELRKVNIEAPKTTLPQVIIINKDDEDIEIDEQCELRKINGKPPTVPYMSYPQIVIVEKDDIDGLISERSEFRKMDQKASATSFIRNLHVDIVNKVDELFEHFESDSSLPQSEIEDELCIAHTIMQTQEQHVSKDGDEMEEATNSRNNQQSKPKTGQKSLKHKQLELHRYRLAVEHKRLELLDLKLAHEREEMLYDKILFEKEMELRAYQLKKLKE